MKRDIFKEIGVVLVFAFILYMFYRSWWAFTALVPAALIYHRFNKKQIKERNKAVLTAQFKDALVSMTAALRAGYSMENALNEAASDMRSIYGEKSAIYKGLSQVMNEIRLGISIEKALTNFAERSGGVSDVITFVSIYRIASRSGGDLVEIIKKTSDDIASKIDTQGEIAVLISSKKLEQRIMSCMPIGIIVYITLASPDLVAPLYGNLTGALTMTICLAVYAAAYFLSMKIMNIEV